MHEFLKIDVSDHTEKKNGLTYLSWAWAWMTVLKHDPDATWEAVEYISDGETTPCMYLRDATAMVKVHVTVLGKTKSCLLPVMDHRNKAIQNPDSFQINTAIMRCLAKAISMHGIALYIYANEDLPIDDEPKQLVRPESFPSKLHELAFDITELAQQKPESALQHIHAARLDREQEVALSNLLDAHTINLLKKAKQRNEI